MNKSRLKSAYMLGIDAVNLYICNTNDVVETIDHIVDNPHAVVRKIYNPYKLTPENQITREAALHWAFDAGVHKALGLKHEAYKGLRNARRCAGWTMGIDSVD